MGARGSGRWFWHHTKLTTKSLPRIQVSTLKKSGCLKPGFTGELSWSTSGVPSKSFRFKAEKDQILIYAPAFAAEQKQSQQPWATIQISRMPCYYGGHQEFFRCPWCDRRAKSLYVTKSGFGCRVCLDLTYESQQKNDIHRLIDRINRIFEQLGAPKTNTLAAVPERPPGIRRKTYSRLKGEAEDAQVALFEAVVRRFGPCA